jgi:mono/diheme cytochrome c family protein
MALLALSIGLAIVLIGMGFAVSNWTEEARVRKLKNPVPSTPEALAAGKQLYQQHCQRCHGAKGDGKGEKAPELSVAPGDFTDVAKMRRAVDGELYWQITEGRLPMPAFADKVSEKGRWELVDYIRTFADKAPPQSSAATPSALSTKGP